MDPDGEEEAHGEWDAEDVVDAGPDEVSADGGEDGFGEVECGDDVEEVGTHEDDVGGFNGDGGAGGEGDTNCSSDESRRVVDAVADLYQHTPLSLSAN